MNIKKILDENFLIFTLLYTFLYILFIATFPLPFPLIILTSSIFNPFIATMISTVSITLGSMFFFIVFFKLHLDKIFTLKNIKKSKIFLKIKKNELLAVSIFRLTGGGGLPFVIQNIILVYSRIKLNNFVIGTFIGILPSIFLLSLLGLGIFEGLKLLLEY